MSVAPCNRRNSMKSPPCEPEILNGLQKEPPFNWSNKGDLVALLELLHGNKRKRRKSFTGVATSEQLATIGHVRRIDLHATSSPLHSTPSSLLLERQLPPASQNALRALHFPVRPIVFLLLKQFSSELERRPRSSSLRINLIIGETDAGESRPGVDEDGDHARVRLPSTPHFWHTTRSSIRIYACRLCSNAKFMQSVWQRYDALATNSELQRTPLQLPHTVSALKCLATSCPALLGVSA